jgi:hypothetical protein
MRLIGVAATIQHWRIVAAMLLVVACARTGSAQPPPEDVLLKRAHKKMTAGIVLLCAGAVTLPVTAADTKWSGPAKITALPLIGTGAGASFYGDYEIEKRRADAGAPPSQRPSGTRRQFRSRISGNRSVRFAAAIVERISFPCSVRLQADSSEVRLKPDTTWL